MSVSSEDRLRSAGGDTIREPANPPGKITWHYLNSERTDNFKSSKSKW